MLLVGYTLAGTNENWSFEEAAEAIFIKEVNFDNDEFSSFSMHKLTKAIEQNFKENEIDQEITIITDSEKLRINARLKNLTLSQCLKILDEGFQIHSRFEGNILYLTRSIYAFKDPVKDFKEDLAAGQLYSYSIGNPSEDSMEFDRILKEEYGILTVFHGCCVDSLTVAYAHAYNFQLDQHLKKKYGEDIFLKISNRLKDKKNELKPEVGTLQPSHFLAEEMGLKPSPKHCLVGDWVEISGDPDRILSVFSINSDFQLKIIEYGNYDFFDSEAYSGEWDSDFGSMRYDLGKGRSMTLDLHFGPNAFLMEAYGLDPSKYSMGQQGRAATYFKRIEAEEPVTTPE